MVAPWLRSLGQAALPGFEPAPRPTDRLFFAALPDAAAAQQVARLAQRLRGELRLSGKPLGIERYHVTLNFLGDHAGLPPGLVEIAATLVARVATAPFEVVFDRVASFGRPSHSPLVLRGGAGVAGLDVLRQAIVRAFEPAGQGHPTPSRYTPHLTLLYDDRRIPELPIEPIGWTAREFVLVHSAIGQSRHTVLGRWPLRA